MIQKKILWGEPERSLREAQRMLKYEQSRKALAQVRAGVTAGPTTWTADPQLNDLGTIKAATLTDA